MTLQFVYIAYTSYCHENALTKSFSNDTELKCCSNVAIISSSVILTIILLWCNYGTLLENMNIFYGGVFRDGVIIALIYFFLPYHSYSNLNELPVIKRLRNL